MTRRAINRLSVCRKHVDLLQTGGAVITKPADQ